MKKITLLLVSLCTSIVFSQQGINYKAIIKDGGGNVVASTAITVQFIILEGTTNVYEETHTPTTDTNGIIILNIGDGTTSDVFTDINWASDEHFLNTQMNTGSGLTDMGTTQFMAVPYAKLAEKVSQETDPKVGTLTTGYVPNWNGTTLENGTIFNSATNVGIGTNTPTDRLVVSGGRVEMTGTTDASGFTGTGVLEIANSLRIDGNEIITNTNLDLYLNHDNNGDVIIDNNTFRVDASVNKVGIGTATPGTIITDSKLDVVGGHIVVSNNFGVLSYNSTGDGVGAGFDTTSTDDLHLYAGGANSLTIANNGTITAPTFDISEITDDKALITKEYADANYNSVASGLEEITENGKIGHRIRGRNPANHGDIGIDAVDLSYSDTPSATYGATGYRSTAMGAFTTASANYSTAMGWATIASGHISTAMGVYTNASSYNSTAIGSYNIGGGSADFWFATDPLFEIGNGDNNIARSNAMTVLKNGNVGIGTHTPGYPLHVTTSVSGVNSSPAYYLSGTAGHGAGGGGWYYSIGASAGIYSSLGFGTGSDQRIKNIIGVSDANKDLKHLLNIEITDYTFKDYKKRGNKVTKKIIAQQLKEVLPNAIIYSTEFIPNIYALADIHIKDDKTVQLHLANSPDVVVGDIIKLIAKKNQELQVTIIAVTDTTIEVSIEDTKDLGNQLFVYGKQVDDFHSVDYDAISMLNVSATQAQQYLIEELQKEVDALKKENTFLQTEVSEIDNLKQDIAEIKALLFSKIETTNTLTQNK